MNAPLITEECLSTHGGAGYVAGSYWKGDKIVCGMCAREIENPRPTGGHLDPPRPVGFVAVFRWWWHRDLIRRVPDWGDAVSGSPPKEIVDRLAVPLYPRKSK